MASSSSPVDDIADEISGLALEQLAYEDQGSHEMEFCSGPEDALKEKMTKCTKNPKHEKFIPFPEFNISHLPERYQNKDLEELIKCYGSLTVRLRMKYTSDKRPKGYPCHKIGGKRGHRFGSGWVSGLQQKCPDPDYDGLNSWLDSDDDNDGNKPKTCPCRECKKSSTPKTAWGEVRVFTAKHVVFDIDEALSTVCEMDYDTDNARGKCPVLIPYKTTSQIDRDYCEMPCITHDLDLFDRIRDIRHRICALEEKVTKKYKPNRQQHKLVVMVSHPHGCSKQVTVGEWTEKHLVESDTESWYIYNTDSCPGSSGAPVFIMGREVVDAEHPHHGTSTIEGLNRSVIGNE